MNGQRGAAAIAANRSTEEMSMLDFWMLVAVIGFFVACVAYVRACELL
jgi:hypothetical protein